MTPRHHPIFRSLLTLAVLLLAPALQAAEPTKWLLGTAYKIPTEYTNQESGYFSIIEGLNNRLYIGCAKYGVNAYLVEFDPKTAAMKMVVDAHKTIGVDRKGFAAQSKFHTRNNVGPSGKIYAGTKQGYPEKDEKRSDYPGGYVIVYDPKTDKAEHFGIAKPQHGIISVSPDEKHDLIYLSTCSDDRPIDHTHFMILDTKKRTYRDLGDMEHAYAFIVLDDKDRAYHPVRGGTIARYDPATDKLERLKVTIDGQPAPKEFTKNDAVLNWDVTPDHKTLFAVEMSTNQFYSFDLTAAGDTIPGKSHGKLLDFAKSTDCRGMCAGFDGRAWAVVTEPGPSGPQAHLVSYKPGDKAARHHGPIGIANPNYTTLTTADGKPKPWHHTLRKEKDGTLTPWVPLGIAAARDGSVYVLTLAPYTLLKFTAEQLK